MATLYKRIKHLQTTKKIRPVSQSERLEFGLFVYREMTKEQPHPYIGKALSVEPEGTFTVRSYPRVMIPEIDKLIIERFRLKRKRIKRALYG